MTRSIALALVCSFLFIGCAPRGTIKPSKLADRSAAEVTRMIEDAIKTTDPNVNIGISIRSLRDNKTIYQKNADRHFVPCSTMKLVTLGAALYYLGPSHRFSTRIFSDSAVKADGTVENIYLQGSGDPSLMDYDVVKLAETIAQRGIKKISGAIYIDDEIFDDVLWGRGNMWDDRVKGYGAPVSGLNVNYNRLLINTVPSLIRGGNAVPIISPKTDFVRVISEATTKKVGGANLSFTLERNKKREDNWPTAIDDGLRLGDKVVVKGQLGQDDRHYATLAINDPGMFAATIFKEELQRLGVKVHGGITRRATPANATKLAQHDSRSLAEALIDFTKISNNVAHDALVKAIAAESGVKPASASAGLKRIGEFLRDEVGIDVAKIVTADGAGLSRYSLVTPDQMVKLLDYTANHFHLGANLWQHFLSVVKMDSCDRSSPIILSKAIFERNLAL